LAISSVYSKVTPSGGATNDDSDDTATSAQSTVGWILAGICSMALVAAMFGVLVKQRANISRKARGITWFPEGFAGSSSGNDRASRRANASAAAAGGHFSSSRQRIGFPDGQEMRSFRASPMKSSLGAGDTKLAVAAYDNDQVYDEVAESRHWSQQHLDAFSPASQHVNGATVALMNAAYDHNGDVGACVGPGGYTPLMVAASYERPDAPCRCQTSTEDGGVYGQSAAVAAPMQPTVMTIPSDDYLGHLIGANAGAMLSQQSEAHGETALHLAARFSRADAAKRLLDAGADVNIQDHQGRTPLHTAVGADAMGVFLLLTKNRSTNLNAQMNDKSTPLVLAARYSQVEMVAALLAAEADASLADDKGKTALH